MTIINKQTKIYEQTNKKTLKKLMKDNVIFYFCITFEHMNNHTLMY